MATRWPYEWSKCDVTCGVGSKLKIRHCIDVVTKERILDEKCTAVSLLLQLVRSCDMAYCYDEY